MWTLVWQLIRCFHFHDAVIVLITPCSLVIGEDLTASGVCVSGGSRGWWYFTQLSFQLQTNKEQWRQVPRQTATKLFSYEPSGWPFKEEIALASAMFRGFAAKSKRRAIGIHFCSGISPAWPFDPPSVTMITDEASAAVKPLRIFHLHTCCVWI